MRRYFHLCTAFFFLSISLAQTSFSSDAYIKVDDNQVGQGILRQRGLECLLITPAHVVENALKIDITLADKTKYSADILELLPGDISVLRIRSGEPAMCGHASWSDNTDLNALLEKETQGELRTRLADGSIRITPVDIIGYDQYQSINVRPKNTSDRIEKGESGSSLYITGRFSGMLLSVKDDIGNVIRQDALANTLSMFFADSHQAGNHGAQPLNAKIPARSPVQEKAPAEEKKFSGIIAESAAAGHPVRLEENCPVLLKLPATGYKEKYTVEIWDSARKVVYRNPGKNYSGTESAHIIFTPLKTDTYSLHITGTEGEGMYTVEIQTLAYDSQLRSPKNIIHIGDSTLEGVIAQGAVAEYRLRLEANSPIRLEFPATGDSEEYRIEILDSTGKTVYRNPDTHYSATETASIPFTAPRNDVYSLHLIGTEGEGKFAVKTISIALNSQLRGEANVIQIGGNTVEGVIAQGAIVEYRFELEAYSPIRLNFTATGDHGKFNVEILDSTKNMVYKDPYKHYSGTESAIIPFTASKKDTYLIRLIGIEGECKYSLNIARTAERS